jgi:hypothetical protein
MKSIEIMQHANSDKILRFLDRDGLLKTLGIAFPKMPRQITDMNPSFLVRSLDYYRALENHRGDEFENEIITMHPEKNIPLSSRNLNPILVSCWSYYKAADLSTSTAWQAFPDTVAAIESTVGDIKQIIDWIAPTSFAFNEPSMESPGSLRAAATHHGKIIYYSPKDDHKTIHDNYNVAPLNCFFKRCEPYLQEREYRFIILFGNHLRFSPEIFSVRLKDTDYIKAIYLKNDIFSNDELQIIKAYYGGLIEFI